MAYQNIKNYLECINPENYNFEFECDINSYCKMNSFERYFTYRATDRKMTDSAYENGKEFAIRVLDEFGTLDDCDGSSNGSTNKLVTEIYTSLWGMEKSDSNSFGKLTDSPFDCEFGADTYNSAQVTMNNVISEIVLGNKSLNDLRKGNFSLRFTLELFANPTTKETFIKELKEYEGLEEFINNYHTIGNFGLVPAGFNAFRGFSGKFYDEKIEDYMDLSLKYLKEFGWDNKFDSSDFNKYINYLFLWDYLDSDGNVKDLNRTDPKEFLKTVNTIIERRGEFIVDMLKLKEELGSNTYNDLRRSVFCRDKVFASYDEVISEVNKFIKNV